MKHLKGIAVVMLLAIGLMTAIPVHAFGKGEKSLGLLGGWASYNSGGYVGVEFQWEFANHFRLNPEIGYVFENNDKSGIFINADMQFPFRMAKGFGIYPLVGATFNNWALTRPDGGKDQSSRFGANFGLGFDLYFTSYLKISAEGKYSLMNNTSGFFVGASVAYIF